MRPPVDEDRPVERSHVLKMVRAHLASQRILFREEACAADAAPLVRQRMRPALVLRRVPDRFGRGISAQATGLVERNPRVIGERRLPGVFGVIEPPVPRDVRRAATLGGRAADDEGRSGNRQQERRNPRSVPYVHVASRSEPPMSCGRRIIGRKTCATPGLSFRSSPVSRRKPAAGSSRAS